MLHACFWFLLDYRKKSQVILPPLHQYVMFVQFIHPFPYPVTHYPLWLYLASFYQQTSFLTLFFSFFLFFFLSSYFFRYCWKSPVKRFKWRWNGSKIPCCKWCVWWRATRYYYKMRWKIRIAGTIFLFISNFFLSQFINFLFFFITTSLL